MTSQQYIEIAKLLEERNPSLFEQLNAELNCQINVELLFIDFCVVLELKVSQVIERPYNREASKLKALFIGVLLKKLQKEKLPRGYKKELAEVLMVDIRKIGTLVQNVTLFYDVYPLFKKEIEEIINKLKSV